MHIEAFKIELAEILMDTCEQSGVVLAGEQRKELLIDCVNAGAELHQKTGGDAQQALLILAESLFPFLRDYPREEAATPVILRAPLWKVQNSKDTVWRMLNRLWDKKFTGHPLIEHMRTVARSGALQVGKGKEVWYQKYKGTDAHYHYLPNQLTKLFNTNVYFIDTDDRCSHHWMLGRTGSGKTSLLQWWLWNDLRMAVEGKCSVIVIDGKDLVKPFKEYKAFAPGEPLHGKLTIVDAEYPVPLNPFYLERGGVDIAAYMLGALAHATDMQQDAFDWMARAASYADRPSIKTVWDFFELDARSKSMPKEFGSYDENTARWFRTVFHDLPFQTVRGIKSRMPKLFKHEGFASMLTAEGFGVHIGELAEPGHVLLVDTDRSRLGDEASAALGRMFIALVDQLSTARLSIKNKRSLSPIWLYLDEAHTYVGHDPHFIRILDQARSQRIGVTVAHQRIDGQISPEVRAALEDCNLKTNCLRMEGKGKRGEFEVSRQGRPPIHFQDNQNISQVFGAMPPHVYEAMRHDMQRGQRAYKPPSGTRKQFRYNPPADDRNVV